MQAPTSKPFAQLFPGALSRPRASASTLSAPMGPDSQDLRHMGMWVEGVRAADGAGADAEGGSERLLVARNKTTGRRWIVDPVTGFGHPEDPEPAVEAQAGQVEIPLTSRHPRHDVEPRSGPFPCEHCGKCKMLVLRLPDRSVMKKCLACRRFVVDGRVERAPRAARPVRDEPAPRRRRRVGRLPSTPVSLPLLPTS